MTGASARRPRMSLGRRLILSSLFWLAIALPLAGLGIAGILEGFVERQFRAAADAAMVAVMAAVEVDEDGRVVLVTDPSLDPRYGEPLSGWYWQIEQDGRVAQASASLINGDLAGRQAEGEELQLYHRDFSAPGGTVPLRLILALPRVLLDDELNTVLAPLGLALALLGLGLVGAVAVQIRWGLSPLRRFSRQLVEARQGRRGELDPDAPRELALLAEEINALIAHNHSIVERAQRHVGDLAHGLRTPLAVVMATGDQNPEVVAAMSRMSRLIDFHLKRARGIGAHGVIGVSTLMAPVCDDLALVLSGQVRDAGLRLDIDCPPDARFAGDRRDAEEMLGNLMDNAVKWARGHVSVIVREDGDALDILVGDDGPGIPADRRRQVVARGGRLDETMPGHGLGLAIVQELAALHGGALTLETAPSGGLLARLRLPCVKG